MKIVVLKNLKTGNYSVDYRNCLFYSVQLTGQYDPLKLKSFIKSQGFDKTVEECALSNQSKDMIVLLEDNGFALFFQPLKFIRESRIETGSTLIDAVKKEFTLGCQIISYCANNRYAVSLSEKQSTDDSLILNHFFKGGFATTEDVVAQDADRFAISKAQIIRQESKIIVDQKIVAVCNGKNNARTFDCLENLEELAAKMWRNSVSNKVLLRKCERNESKDF